MAKLYFRYSAMNAGRGAALIGAAPEDNKQSVRLNAARRDDRDHQVCGRCVCHIRDEAGN